MPTLLCKDDTHRPPVKMQIPWSLAIRISSVLPNGQPDHEQDWKVCCKPASLALASLCSLRQ